MNINQQYYTRLEHFYSEIYNNNQDRWSSEPQMREVSKHLYEYLNQHLTSPDDVNYISLLDVGCGKGYDSYFFASKGMEVIGIDPCEQPTWSTNAYKNISFVKSSIFDLQLSQKFNIIFDNGCFHHLDPNDYSCFLETINSFLCNDGILCINVFCKENTELVSEDNSRYTMFFSSQQLISLLAQHGFEAIHTKYLKRENKITDYLFCIFKYNKVYVYK